MTTGVLKESLKAALADLDARARKAMEAYRSLSNQDSDYAAELFELAHVHKTAANVYRDALTSPMVKS